MRANLEKLGKELARAWNSGDVIPLPRIGEGPSSRAEAYAVQDRMAEDIPQKVVGWKVGAAVEAVQFFEGHDGPIPGRIFEDRLYEGHAELPAARFSGTKIESEIAFSLASPLPGGSGPVSVQDLRGKLTFHPAIEMSAVRYAPGTGERAANTHDGIADNGTSGAVVVGAGVTDWEALGLETIPVDARIDSSAPIQVYSDVYRKDPVQIVADTLSGLHARGIEFEVGMYLFTGSLTLPTPIRKGQKLTVRFGDLPEISLRLN